MITSIQAEEVLKELGSIHGEKLEFDVNGNCTLVSEDQHLILLHYGVEQGAILISGVVGQLPEDEDLKIDILKSFMRANFLWHESFGGTFAYEPETNSLMFQSAFSDSEDKSQGFANKLNKFTFELGYWKQQFKDMPEELDEE